MAECHLRQNVIYVRVSFTSECHLRQSVIYVRVSFTSECHLRQSVIYVRVSFTSECHIRQSVIFDISQRGIYSSEFHISQSGIYESERHISHNTCALLPDGATGVGAVYKTASGGRGAELGRALYVCANHVRRGVALSVSGDMGERGMGSTNFVHRTSRIV